MVEEEPAAAEPLPVPELAAELEPETSIQTETPDEYSPTTELTDTKSYELRDALARTTAAMEIEALAEAPQEPVEPPAPEPEPMIDRWPWEVAAVAPAEAVAMPLGATVVPDEEVDVDPEAAYGAEEVSGVFAAVDDVETEPVTPSAFLDDLEPIPSTPEAQAEEPEPADTSDAGPLVVAVPESMAAVSEPEPYAEPASAPAMELESETTASVVELDPEPEPLVEPEPDPDPPTELEPELTIEPEPEPEPEPEHQETPVPGSSEPVDPEPDAPAGYESVADSASMDSYVCDDCVYVDTCPNKDQRVPKDCGSFQWK
jgi:pilus assembly protein FimV